MLDTKQQIAKIDFSLEEKKVLDELSDGQWHPEYKIKREVGNSKVLETLQSLNQKALIISGENNSFRMNGEVLTAWRELTDFKHKNTPRYTPRFFGGILEDDGWMLAELKSYDLIHFRLNGDISKTEIENIIGRAGSVARGEDGLYRIFIQGDGSNVYDLIKHWKDSDAVNGFTGVRLEKNIKRRDLKDLPHRFTADLCKYYGNFAKVLLRPNMTSITKHIADPDDIQQQIYLWVIDAIQRYDHTTSIPFAAYLGKMLSKWVFNLNRQSFGRHIADTELKHSRVVNQFRTDNGREPTLEELADALGEGIEIVRSEKKSISSVANLRTVGTIDSDEAPLHIASTEDVTKRYENNINQTLLSAAITSAAAAGGGKDLNIVGWLAVYHSTWGDPKNKKLLPTTDQKVLQNKSAVILQEAQTRLKKLGVY